MLESELIDPATIDQMVNHIVVNSYMSTNHHYAAAARRTLKEMSIAQLPRGRTPLSNQDLSRIRYDLSKGKRLPSFPSVLGGKPGPRFQKDKMYERFYALIDLTLPDPTERVYCGLPANQLGMIAHRLGNPRKIYACETDHDMWLWMKGFHFFFMQHDRQLSKSIEIHHRDIIEVLYSLKNQVNIIDLDLMCHLGSVSQMAGWAHAIRVASQDICVVNFTTGIGRRGPSELEYQSLMPHVMVELFKKEGFKRVEFTRFGYRDRVIPMRCEHFILRK